jgi:pterin-4a-carbinolamine dehydratase
MFYEQSKHPKIACWFKIKIEVTFSTHQIEKRSIILGFDSNEKKDQQQRVIDGYTVEL